MKKLLIPATLLMLGLTACAGGAKTAAPQTEAASSTPAPAVTAAAPVSSIDAKKEVAYLCGAKGKDPLRVMYGLKGNEVVAAQVLYQERLSPVLYRDASREDGNVFSGESGITWSAFSATAANVDKVNGNMLTQPGKEVVNGQEMAVTQIVTKYCKLDKKATAKLQQAAK